MDQLTLRRLAEILGGEIGREIPCEPSLRLIADLGLDSLELYQIDDALHAIEPRFEVPDQHRIEDVTLRDLLHYLQHPQS